jgi:hypothetical protein
VEIEVIEVIAVIAMGQFYTSWPAEGSGSLLTTLFQYRIQHPLD